MTGTGEEGDVELKIGRPSSGFRLVLSSRGSLDLIDFSGARIATLWTSDRRKLFLEVTDRSGAVGRNPTAYVYEHNEGASQASRDEAQRRFFELVKLLAGAGVKGLVPCRPSSVAIEDSDEDQLSAAWDGSPYVSVHGDVRRGEIEHEDLRNKTAVHAVEAAAIAEALLYVYATRISPTSPEGAAAWLQLG